MNDYDLKTTYLDGPNGPLFCMNFLPIGRQRSLPDVVIHVPPFAEEMNKSRPMVSTQAKQMASVGYPVVLFDLSGTGDSSGQFKDATWEGWINDLRFICDWVIQNFSVEKVILWGLRAGCLLAGDYAQRDTNQVSRLLFWQPIVSGEQVLTQLGRLDQLSSPGKQSNFHQLVLDGNEVCIEIAGYELNAVLLQEMSETEFSNWRMPQGVHLDWLEVTPLEDGKLRRTSEQLLNALREVSNHDVRIRIVTGEPFWFTQEVSMVPALLEQTLNLLSNTSGDNPSADN